MKPFKKVLVCGGRDFNDQQKVDEILSGFIASECDEDAMIIEGGARGADRCAKNWAIRSGVHYAEVISHWSHYGKAAGGMRNDAMLLLEPDYCIAFPGGRGTADMVKKASEAGVIVWEPLYETEREKSSDASSVQEESSEGQD